MIQNSYCSKTSDIVVIRLDCLALSFLFIGGFDKGCTLPLVVPVQGNGVDET